MKLSDYAQTFQDNTALDAASLDFLGVSDHNEQGGPDVDYINYLMQQAADIFDLTHTAAHRERHEALFRRAGDDIEDGVAVLVARRDVEEGELVGAGGIVDAGLLDRIAGVAQADEVHALHHAPVLDVQAGDDAHLQHQADAAFSASPGRIVPA